MFKNIVDGWQYFKSFEGLNLLCITIIIHRSLTTRLSFVKWWCLPNTYLLELELNESKVIMIVSDMDTKVWKI